MFLSFLYPSNTMVTRPTPSNFFVPSQITPVISNRNFKFPRACASRNPIRIYPTTGTIQNGKFWLNEVEFKVRDYELDQFGLVKNAVYANYCEDARLVALKRFGYTSADMVAGSGCAIALMDLSLNLIAPLKSGDNFLVKVRANGWTRTRLFVEHRIVKLPKQEPIVKALATVVWLDDKYRPVRIPSEDISTILDAHDQRSY